MKPGKSQELVELNHLKNICVCFYLNYSFVLLRIYLKY